MKRVDPRARRARLDLIGAAIARLAPPKPIEAARTLQERIEAEGREFHERADRARMRRLAGLAPGAYRMPYEQRSLLELVFEMAGTWDAPAPDSLVDELLLRLASGASRAFDPNATAEERKGGYEDLAIASDVDEYRIVMRAGRLADFITGKTMRELAAGRLDFPVPPDGIALAVVAEARAVSARRKNGATAGTFEAEKNTGGES